MDSPSAELSFDTIETEDGRRLSVAQFFALPLADRIRFILDRKLQFFCGGAAVDVHLGLHALMSRRR